MGLEVRFLPARQGDAIWIRWGEHLQHQALVDMGTEEVGVTMRSRLAALAEQERIFELLVVTHVDRDHIGGVLTCLAEPEAPLDGLVFHDVWFNGWAHLGASARVHPGATAVESMGPAQGERLSSWLASQSWNAAFGGGPVVRDDDPVRVEMSDGMTFTVLGPARPRLADLKPIWKEEVELALTKGTLKSASPGLESYGGTTPPVLECVGDLEELADKASKADDSKANGSSIALLLEWRGRTIVLAGDAYAGDLVEALKRVRGGLPVPVDLFKLPHHGSRNNVTDALVTSVDCPVWLFSTDGTQFRHPDAIAVARVLRSSGKTRMLAFNVPSIYNRWWNDEQWRARFGYDVQYGSATDGIAFTFEARAS